MTELLALPFSPWSEKARWALDVRKVPYRYRHYQPLIGELELRLRTRRLRGVVTVPLLIDDGGRVYDDSAAIARFADTHGEGPTLFPAEHEPAIARFIELSERGLSAGRALSLKRQLADDEALAELVPREIRRRVGRLGLRLADLGLRRTLRKYRALRLTQDQHRAHLRSVLDELRAALEGAQGEPKTLLGRFTFADIAVAQVLSFVSPPTFGLKLGKASRRGFTDPE
ncbi:MAG TPA: glutathione S-transferase N-terminal domain-containing protein, partial [Polyangiales bacterium]